MREKLAADLSLALSLASWGRQASLIEGGRGGARGGWWRWGRVSYEESGGGEEQRRRRAVAGGGSLSELSEEWRWRQRVGEFTRRRILNIPPVPGARRGGEVY